MSNMSAKSIIPQYIVQYKSESGRPYTPFGMSTKSTIPKYIIRYEGESACLHPVWTPKISFLDISSGMR